MRKTLGVLGVSNRGQGAAGTYGERSPEFEQRAEALSCCRFRGYRPCACKRKVSVDVHGDVEQASMNHRQRGVRCSPESPAGVRLCSGGVSSNTRSLGATVCGCLGVK